MITWKLDQSHSELNFQVTHMMISKVKGQFKSFDAEIVADDATFENVTIVATVQTNSIDTNNSDRDIHLKGTDFFHVEKYPVMSFQANQFHGETKGLLTLHGITKEIILNVEFGGTNTDPWGSIKAGFSFQGVIKRSDFGLTWNAALETGGVLVSDEVKIGGELQFIQE